MNKHLLKFSSIFIILIFILTGCDECNEFFSCAEEITDCSDCPTECKELTDIVSECVECSGISSEQDAAGLSINATNQT